METKIYSLPKEGLEEVLQKAGQIIKDGGLVAFPTETVYGLGGDALNPLAASKIYEAKGRPSDNPLIIHISELNDLERIACDIPEYGWALAKKFWPGPLTLIFQKKDSVPLKTTGGLETVAVRLPENEVARAFIKAAGGFVAAPSANLSGRPSPTKGSHVVEDLSGRIEAIILGDDARIGLESTIVDCSLDIPALLRPGFISPEQIRELTGDLIEGSIHINEDEGPKAPGMKYKHYAPKGELYLVEGSGEEIISYIQRSWQDLKEKPQRIGILCYEENAPIYESHLTLPLGKENEEKVIAASLFDALRRMDRESIDIIFSEITAHSSLGDAIMNRLYKAAGFKRLKAKEGRKLF